MKTQQSIDRHTACGTLTIRLLPGSIAARAIAGTLAAIRAGEWDGTAKIAKAKR